MTRFEQLSAYHEGSSCHSLAVVRPSGAQTAAGPFYRWSVSLGIDTVRNCKFHVNHVHISNVSIYHYIILYQYMFSIIPCVSAFAPELSRLMSVSWWTASVEVLWLGWFLGQKRQQSLNLKDLDSVWKQRDPVRSPSTLLSHQPHLLLPLQGLRPQPALLWSFSCHWCQSLRPDLDVENVRILSPHFCWAYLHVSPEVFFSVGRD